MKLNIQLVRDGAIMPKYQSTGAAGLDLHACIEAVVTVEPGAHVAVPTGVALELPHGFEAQIRARSGLAAKHQIGLTNGIGTIDSDYRGELIILLMNWGKEPFVIEPNMRIAQMVIARYERVDLTVVKKLSNTQRGGSGFGSTGTAHKIG